jgi:hypothetical protein
MQVWIVTTVAAIALFLQVRGVPPALSRWDGFAELCQRIFGRVGTPQHVIFMNLFPALMLYHFFRHHRRRGSPDPHKKPAPLHEGPLPLHFTVQEPHAGRIGNPTRVLAPEPTQRRGCPPR